MTGVWSCAVVIEKQDRYECKKLHKITLKRLN